MSKNDNTGLYFGVGAGILAALAFANRKAIIDTVVSPTQFLLKYYSDAKKSEQATGVPALVTLAQAGLESNWGKSAPGFNFFGIKSSGSWKGLTQKLRTWECGSTGNATKDGIHDEVIAVYPPGNSHGNSSCNAKGFYSYRVYGIFRAYNSAADGFTDHGRFLKDNKRYEKAFSTSTPEAFITEVHRAGYATDPSYSSKIINLMVTTREVLTRAGLA